MSLNADVLRAYLAAGGIVISEYQAADNVYNASFDEQVAAGEQGGDAAGLDRRGGFVADLVDDPVV